MRTILMEDFVDAQSGNLIGVDYAFGAKVGRPVRVGVELDELKLNDETKEWVWTGRIVKCSPALVDKYLGTRLWIWPRTPVAVMG